MDPSIIKFLAERLGLSLQEVEALARGDAASVIAGRSGSDPALAALLALVSQGASSAGGRDAADTRDPRPARPRRTAQRAGDREVEQARRAVRHLRRDLHAVDTIFRHLGHVFGACPACFGMSDECGRCRGNGVPGSMVPLREELLAWVVPALARLGLQVTPIPAREQDGDDELH